MVKILCVAEKPSMSKALTQILSGGQFNSVRPRLTTDPSFPSALGRKYYLMLYELSSYVLTTCSHNFLAQLDSQLCEELRLRVSPTKGTRHIHVCGWTHYGSGLRTHP